MAIASKSVFNRLIGTWKTSGLISSANETLTLIGTDTYELVLDGKFVLHKANVIMGDAKSETIEMINLTDHPIVPNMHYFNSHGNVGVMTGKIVGNNYSIEGNGIKFKGTINEENSEIVGKWFLQSEDKSWSEYIDLKLERL